MRGRQGQNEGRTLLTSVNNIRTTQGDRAEELGEKILPLLLKVWKKRMKAERSAATEIVLPLSGWKIEHADPDKSQKHDDA